MKSINENNFDRKVHIKEIKCTCKQCGKIWHYLEDEEKGLKSQAGLNALIGCGTCGSPIGALFSNKSIDTSRELNKLKKCPECGSQNIKKESIFYEKENESSKKQKRFGKFVLVDD